MSIPFTTASLRTFVFATSPTKDDDITLGYEIGNRWRNTTTFQVFECLDNTEGNAIWVIKPAKTTGSITPSIEFGGASVGITYSSREGNFLQIDDATYFSIFIALSSKGTSIGEARVLGIPTANGSNNFAFNFYGHRLINIALYNGFGARLAPLEDQIRIFEVGALQPISALLDTSFQNNSQLFVSGFYFT